MCDNLILAAREQVAALAQSAYEKAAEKGLLPAGAEIKGQVDIPMGNILGKDRKSVV